MRGAGKPIVWSSLAAASAALAALALDPAGTQGLDPTSALAQIFDVLRTPALAASNPVVQYILLFVTYVAILGGCYWAAARLASGLQGTD